MSKRVNEHEPTAPEELPEDLEEKYRIAVYARVFPEVWQQYSTVVEDRKSLPWQKIYDKGFQLSVAIAVWMAYKPEDRLELCGRFAREMKLPEATGKGVQTAVSAAMKREPPRKSGT